MSPGELHGAGIERVYSLETVTARKDVGCAVTLAMHASAASTETTDVSLDRRSRYDGSATLLWSAKSPTMLSLASLPTVLTMFAYDDPGRQISITDHRCGLMHCSARYCWFQYCDLKTPLNNPCSHEHVHAHQIALIDRIAIINNSDSGRRSSGVPGRDDRIHDGSARRFRDDARCNERRNARKHRHR